MPRNDVVGARELKARLGTYLRRVRHGHTLVITDRGQPIAELRPIDARSGVEATLLKLEAAGAVTRSTGRTHGAFRHIDGRGPSMAAAVVEDRKDRF